MYWKNLTGTLIFGAAAALLLIPTNLLGVPMWVLSLVSGVVVIAGWLLVVGRSPELEPELEPAETGGG